MKKGYIVLIVVAVFLLIIYVSIKGIYNNMVTMDVDVSAKWSQVEAEYQRRLDLIPNLVNTVQGYANFEKSTLTDVMNARASATRVNIDASQLTPANMQQFEQAQAQVSSSLSRLLVSVEAYPNLKANENFMALQAQLEGTENRITVARKYFIDAAQDYDTYIRKFPQVIFAGMFGMQYKAFFQAAPEASKAPTVNFPNTK